MLPRRHATIEATQIEVTGITVREVSLFERFVDALRIKQYRILDLANALRKLRLASAPPSIDELCLLAVLCGQPVDRQALVAIHNVVTRQAYQACHAGIVIEQLKAGEEHHDVTSREGFDRRANQHA